MLHQYIVKQSKIVHKLNHLPKPKIKQVCRQKKDYSETRKT